MLRGVPVTPDAGDGLRLQTRSRLRFESPGAQLRPRKSSCNQQSAGPAPWFRGQPGGRSVLPRGSVRGWHVRFTGDRQPALQTKSYREDSCPGLSAGWAWFAEGTRPARVASGRAPSLSDDAGGGSLGAVGTQGKVVWTAWHRDCASAIPVTILTTVSLLSGHERPFPDEQGSRRLSQSCCHRDGQTRPLSWVPGLEPQVRSLPSLAAPQHQTYSHTTLSY